MKISNIFQATNIFQKNVKQKNEKKIIEKKKDNINISSKALDFQTAMKAVNNSPNVRQEKIDAITKKINEGTYFISSEQIANKILEN